jgi:hypothetical protein
VLFRIWSRGGVERGAVGWGRGRGVDGVDSIREVRRAGCRGLGVVGVDGVEGVREVCRVGCRGLGVVGVDGVDEVRAALAG